MKRKKTFDCVEMQHRGGALTYKKIKDMSPEEELAYWRERDRQFGELQETFRRQGTPAPTPPAGS